jgi:DNA-binding CsgD family transcriptional regulator
MREIVISPGLSQLGLNLKESETVLWISEGFSIAEVGEMLNIQPRSIRVRLFNACRKLDLLNREELIRICKPLITVEDVAFAKTRLERQAKSLQADSQVRTETGPLSVGQANARSWE